MRPEPGPAACPADDELVERWRPAAVSMRIGLAELHCGDCRDILPRYAGQASVIIADPPYAETSLSWDRRCDGWLPLAKAALALHGSLWLFGSLRSFLMNAGDFETGWRFGQDVVWEKHNGSNLHADRFKRVHELVAQFYPVETPWATVYKEPVTTPTTVARATRRKRRPTHTGHIEAGPYLSVDGGPRLMRSVVQVRSCHGYADHPTQKPVAIIEPLIRYSCPPDGLVLDPFAGVASAGVAALRLGRRYVGIEASPDYAEIGARRLREAVAQPSLFGDAA